jgi:hypothetical protein
MWKPVRPPPPNLNGLLFVGLVVLALLVVIKIFGGG